MPQCSKVLISSFRHENEMKAFQISKLEIKLSLYACDMISFIRNPKKSTKKLSEIMSSERSPEYKVNVQNKL